MLEAFHMDYDAVMTMPVTRRYRMIREKSDLERKRRQQQEAASRRR
jgi:hypothetical protein